MSHTLATDLAANDSTLFTSEEGRERRRFALGLTKGGDENTFRMFRNGVALSPSPKRWVAVQRQTEPLQQFRRETKGH